MKQQRISWQLIVVITLLQSAMSAFGQTKTAAAHEVNFYCNPLLLDDKPTNYSNFSIYSKGQLSVVVADKKTAALEKIPFRIYLRRNGKLVTQGVSDSTRSVVSIEISSVLALARFGDHLIIEPVRKSDEGTRRNIELKSPFETNILSFLMKGKDGC